MGGLSVLALLLCITIVISRATALALYVKAIGDVPNAKLDYTPLILGAVILAFYAYSAVQIFRADLRGYHRLTRMSLVFGLIQAISIVQATSKIQHLDAVHEVYPLLWAIIVPIPIALVALHLLTSAVAFMAGRKLAADAQRLT